MHRHLNSTALAVFGLALTVGACAVQADDTALLFDGKSLANWSTLDGEPVSQDWQVVNGMIHLRKGDSRAGHIVTKQQFADFRLSFEWKIAPGGNSGLKYRVHEYPDGFRGCEYQIIDDRGYHKRVAPLNSTGALYDLVAPNRRKRLKPPSEFNASMILVENDCIVHWLNGRRILEIKVGSCGWCRRVAASKFCDLPNFARNRDGKIMLTDHGSEVWYRNFVFTLLPATKTAPQKNLDPRQQH